MTKKRRAKLDLPRIDRWMEVTEYRLGKPIDQTLGEALAQIQAVVYNRDRARRFEFSQVLNDQVLDAASELIVLHVF